jgi:hypothetical protein
MYDVSKLQDHDEMADWEAVPFVACFPQSVVMWVFCYE